MVKTVQFNVGGKIFEVSRDLIDQNPETMLSKLISETWEKKPDKPVFIDRDGDLFSHVLNYLRYGSIELPPSVPQSMFERELDYYGISITPSSVSKLSLGELTQHLTEHKRKWELFLFAVECHYRFSQGEARFQIQKEHKLYDSCRALVLKKDFKIVNSFLGEYYGLTVERAGSDLNCNEYYQVSIRKGK